MDKLTYNDLDDIGLKIVSFPYLKEKIEKNLCCKECVRERHRSSIIVSQTTYKLATVLTFRCDYGHKFDISPDRIDETKPYSSANFKINMCFVLAMQLLGKGLRTMSIFLGILGIRVSEGNYKIWKKIQDQIGESQQTVAIQCCHENLQKEVEATNASGIMPDEDGRTPVACSGDTGWQGNGSRMTYNSQSGQTTLCGGLTKLVIAFQFFSKLCHTCYDFEKKPTNDSDARPTHRCPRNWTESSKSMEPYGILECIKKIWYSNIAWGDVFISDDDSTSRAAIKHPIQTQILLGEIDNWPLDKALKQIKSTGRLPLEINSVRTFLVDPSHRRRVYGSGLYKLEPLLKGMNKMDVECLIRNFGYAVKQNRGKNEEEFAKAMKAALEHHFDNHIYCNPSWCHFREDSEKKIR